jgi:exodeoxyribonuclease VII small subunit
LNRKSRQPDFEKSLQELEQLVERLENGDLPLEESLRTFERGVALTRECQLALQSAQARVEILLKRDGKPEAVPFDAGPDGEAPSDDDGDFPGDVP